ncbi:MAG: SAM-dependent MidA family methyltransferase [Paracoccaceae bacterium]|jgi:SAM-dependent MidA family methyltransferase
MMSHKPADLTGLQQAFPYPRFSSEATPDLARIIISEIKKSGPLPFRDYMARCLYHPQHGYYARTSAPTVSKKGDFMTSVSVGPVFGQILARRLHRFWQGNGSPSSFTILELGAHDGSLALDIISALPQIDPAFSAATSYLISEPLPARHDLLKSRLLGKATVIRDPSELRTDFGALIANEVLDALPVPIFLFSQNAWHEALVTVEKDTLAWTTRPANPDLPENYPEGQNYPEGYVTEGPPDLSSFLPPLSHCFQKALFLWIDYGLDQESLHHPARTAGTLRCYRNHRSDAHPLDFPGEQDLTADVNFTTIENTARDLGLQVHPTMNQSRYLTYCAKEWLLAGPGPAEIRQFQTLIHPSQFGNRFYALELTKGDVQRAFP